MEDALFLYTILTMLICAVAATVTFSSSIVTNNPIYTASAVLFLAYFFDVSLIFQGEFTNHGQPISLVSYYGIPDPVTMTLLFSCVLGSVWYAVIYYIDGTPLRECAALWAMPLAVFFVLSYLCYTLISDMQVRQWTFYSTRELFLLWCAAYAVYRYRHCHSPLEQLRLRRAKPLFIVTLIFTGCTVLENTLFIFIWNPTASMGASLLAIYLANRNFSENFLIIAYAIFALIASSKTLRLRAKEPPSPDEDAIARHLEDLMPAYCERYGLTRREEEILRHLLGESDYQNIASDMQLAVGTIKSHTHNILQKTHQSNRECLRQHFWSE